MDIDFSGYRLSCKQHSILVSGWPSIEHPWCQETPCSWTAGRLNILIFSSTSARDVGAFWHHEAPIKAPSRTLWQLSISTHVFAFHLSIKIYSSMKIYRVLTNYTVIWSITFSERIYMIAWGKVYKFQNVRDES